MATTPNSVICQACGGEVVSFVHLPTMWHVQITEAPGVGSPIVETLTVPVDQLVCVSCMTDILKFFDEVLRHKWDAAKASVDGGKSQLQP